jgi:hypothetical protein
VEFAIAAISAIGTAAGGTFGAFLIMNAGAVATGLLLAGGLALSSAQARQAKKKAREAYNAGQVDRLANVVTSIAPRELVLGRVRKGGPIAFRGSAGEFKQRFLFHIVLAAHEIDGVEQVWFNDQPITIDPGNGQVQTAPYQRIKKQTIIGNLLLPGSAIITAGNTSVSIPNADPGSVHGLMTSPTGVQTSIPVTLLSGTAYISPQPYDVVLAYQVAEVTPLAWVWWDLGAPGSSVDGGTKLQFPDLWTDAHRGEGIAKLFVMFDYDDTAFPNGMPTVTALIRGAKVYDPRSTNTVWTENPALLARHVYQHQHFGKATISAAEDARFIAAANACDTSQDWVVNGATQTSALYRAGLVVPYGAAAAPVLDDLTQAMAGMWAFAGGELYLRAGVYTAPVMTFTDADVASVQRSGDSEAQDQVSISVHRERAEKFNVVNVRIWDSERDYKQVALSPLKSTALITRDGEELAQEVSIPAVYFSPLALHIAGVMMRDARDPLTVEVPLKMRAYPVELFDTVELAFTRYGWDASPKPFLVLGRIWDHEKGVIRLTLKETAATIFTPDASFESRGYAENTAYETPWDIDSPGTLTLSSGTDELLIGGDGTIMTRVRVSWTAIEDQRITLGGTVEVQWCTIDNQEWKSIVVDGTVSETFIVGVSDGTAILVRARTSNSLATSDWSLQLLHLVTGKTAAPEDVSSFSVNLDGVASWVHVADADVRAGGGYAVRWQPGNNRSWGDATALHEGVLTESPYQIMIRPVGTATFLVKAIDSSGNESVNAAASVVNLGDPLVQNVVTISDYKADGFPGAITNGSVSGGNLVADADASPLAWDSNPDTAGWTLDTDAGWTVITYQPLTYVPAAFIVVAADDGAQLTLPNSIAATAFLISYRRDGDALGWTSDAEPGWTSDAALAWEVEEFRPWPGTLTAREGRYEFQITTQSRDEQSVISELAAQLDVPDVFENVGQVSVVPAGTVIPTTKTFRAITGIGLTLVADGGTATSARVESTATRTVTTRDATDVAVAGTVLATLQGY